MDNLFEPTIDQMVNDFDDEGTLEEEEQLAAIEDPDVQIKELTNLQRESEMPLESLMRLYNYHPQQFRKPRKKRKAHSSDNPGAESNDTDASVSTDSKKVRKVPNDAAPPETADVPLHSTSPLPTTVSEEGEAAPEDDDIAEDDLLGEEEEEPSESELALLLNDSDDEKDFEDVDYVDLKKTILVGENHQAEIPAKNEDSRECDDTGDKLMWSPFSGKLQDEEVENFLRTYSKIKRNHHRKTTEDHKLDLERSIPSVKDDETVLLQLLEANYNVDIALEQVQSSFHKTEATTSGNNNDNIWSEDESKNFEMGLRLYGKNFYLIQQAKVSTRCVSELVQFYYMWKKTERYDSFAAKQRLEKKKNNLSSHNLDSIMDKFLEENQQRRAISPRYPPQTTSSVTEDDPGRSLLIYADSKRHRATPPNSTSTQQHQFTPLLTTKSDGRPPSVPESSSS